MQAAAAVGAVAHAGYNYLRGGAPAEKRSRMQLELEDDESYHTASTSNAPTQDSDVMTIGAMGETGGSMGGGSKTAMKANHRTIGPPMDTPITKTFRTIGTFAISDNGSHNTWTPVPWEFPRLFISSPEYCEYYQKYALWRTKAVRIKLYNPLQRYKYTSTTGVTLTAVDPSAKLLVWLDSTREKGIPIFTDWQQTDWNSFNAAFSFGGFGRDNNSLYVLPYQTDLDQSVNFDQMPGAVADFAPDVSAVLHGEGQEWSASYSPTEHSWRSTEEFVTHPTILYNDGGAAAVPISQISPATLKVSNAELNARTEGFLTPYRADNYSCVRYCPSLAKTSKLSGTSTTEMTGQTILTIDRPWWGRGMTGLGSDTNKMQYFTNNYIPMNIIYNDFVTSSTAQNVASACATQRLFGMPCMEEAPQPMLWVSYRNMITQDGSSPMDQKFLIDVEYEWDVEFTYAPKPSQSTMMLNTTQEVGIAPQYNNALAPMTAMRHRKLFAPNLSPKWIAYPEYKLGEMCNNNEGGNIAQNMPGGVVNWRTHSKIMTTHCLRGVCDLQSL